MSGWIEQSGSPYNVTWRSIASSDDGTKLVAVSNGANYIYTSADSGVTWTKTDAPAANWNSVASNSTGDKLVAVINGTATNSTNGIWTLDKSPTSTNASWTKTDAPPAIWRSVASDSTGDKLVAVINSSTNSTNGIWTLDKSPTSTNAGWTKNASAPAARWSSVASNSTGDKLVAVINSSTNLYTGIWTLDKSPTSTNASWTRNDTAPPTLWTSVASDSTGDKLVAASSNLNTSNATGIWTLDKSPTSTNAGWTKNASAPTTSWWSVASNSTGDKLVALIYSTDGTNGGIWTLDKSPTSTNASWTRNDSGPATNWQSVASDSTGTKLVAVGSMGIYQSINSSNWGCINFNNSSAIWNSVASNSTGDKLVAVSNGTNGFIWISVDSGVTWTKTDAPAASWTSVASNSTGDKLVAVINSSTDLYTGIWTLDKSPTSTNASWTRNDSAPPASWTSVASNSTGDKLVAVINSSSTNSTNGIWTLDKSPTSTNASWTRNDSAPPASWTSVASNSTGDKLVAAIYANGGTNSGIWTLDKSLANANWTRNDTAPPTLWSSVASDSTGDKLVAAINANGGTITGTGIYTLDKSPTSTNASWTRNDSAPPAIWTSVASNSTGDKLVAVSTGTNGFIYTLDKSPTSANAVWTKSDAPAASWQSVASNSTGTKLVTIKSSGSGIVVWEYKDPAYQTPQTPQTPQTSSENPICVMQ